MSGIRIQGATSGNLAEVTANNELQIRPTTDPTQAGYVRIADINGQVLSLDNEGRADVSIEHLFHVDTVPTDLDYRIWAPTLTTYAISAATQYYFLNSAASTASNASALIATWQRFTVMKEGAIYFKMSAMPINSIQANTKVIEMGFGYDNGSALVDGACFRWNASNQFVCVTSNASAETSSAVLSNPTDNVFHTFEIKLTVDDANFFVDGVLVATITRPNTLACIVGNLRLPIFTRVYTGAGTPSPACGLKVGPSTVSAKLYNLHRSSPIAAAGFARNASMSPVTAYAQTAAHANSTDPVSATIANTGIGAMTSLGGRYQFAAVVGAATDYVLYAYQVPAGWRLYITGIKITCLVTGAAVGAGGTVLDWSVGINGTALDISTADSLATKVYATRRIPIGTQGFIAAAAIGVPANDVIVDFSSCPLMVESARYCHIIMENPIGTNTGGLIFRGDVTIVGWFE